MSNVGINSQIIKNGKNGYLVNKNKEWEIYLKKLIKNKKMISIMGTNGRKIVSKYFSNIAVIDQLSNILTK